MCNIQADTTPRSVLLAADLITCPSPDCTGIVSWDGASSSGSGRAWTCQVCKKDCCLSCRMQPYHPGLSCEAYREAAVKAERAAEVHATQAFLGLPMARPSVVSDSRSSAAQSSVGAHIARTVCREQSCVPFSRHAYLSSSLSCLLRSYCATLLTYLA